MALPNAFERAVERSTLVRVVDRSVRHARVSTLLWGLFERLKTERSVAKDWVRGSTAVTWGRNAARAFTKWIDESTLSRSVAITVAWVRASFLYRWLTAEPEPDVIVIDLRETLTVGPIIAMLDRALRTAVPAATKSRLGRIAGDVATAVRDAPVRVFSLLAIIALAANVVVAGLLDGLGPTGLGIRLALVALLLPGLLVRRSWDELQSTWPVRLAVAALEPPPPPESSSTDADDSRSNGTGGADRRDERS